MKKISVIFMIAAVLIVCGCGEGSSGKTEGILSAAVTIFPEYDWVREITRGVDGVEITLLLDKGVDMHSYQPTADDIVKIASCDLFFYVGGASDAWTVDAIAEKTNPDMKALSLLDALGEGVKEELLGEGMQTEEEEEDEGPEYDEHVWLSLKNAQILCRSIADAFCEVDPEHADIYTANCDEYCEKLAALDAQYEEATDLTGEAMVVFGDRFPFRYMADDYNLKYYAAFPGCSAESEASFETIAFLAGKLDEYKLNSIFKLENSDGRIAQTIIDTSSQADCRILSLDSLQSTTMRQAAGGKTYLSAMEQNLEVLKEALKG